MGLHGGYVRMVEGVGSVSWELRLEGPQIGIQIKQSNSYEKKYIYILVDDGSLIIFNYIKIKSKLSSL